MIFCESNIFTRAVARTYTIGVPHRITRGMKPSHAFARNRHSTTYHAAAAAPTKMCTLWLKFFAALWHRQTIMNQANEEYYTQNNNKKKFSLYIYSSRAREKLILRGKRKSRDVFKMCSCRGSFCRPPCRAAPCAAVVDCGHVIDRTQAGGSLGASKSSQAKSKKKNKKKSNKIIMWLATEHVYWND